MKKLILISLISAGTAFASQPVVNQQYVMAAPSTQPNLQRPFKEQTNSQQVTPDSNGSQKNPMNIYVKPRAQQSQPAPHHYAQQQEAYQDGYNNNAYNSPQPSQQKQLYNQNPYQKPQQQNQSTQWQSHSEQAQQQQHPYQRPYQNQYHNSYPAQRPTQQYERNSAPTNAHDTAPTSSSGSMPTTPRYTAPKNPPASSVAPAQSTAPKGIKDSTPGKNNSPYNDTAKTEWFKNCLSAVTTKQLASSARAFCECGWQKISSGGIKPGLFTSTNPADIQRANVLLQNISQSCLMQIVQGR